MDETKPRKNNNGPNFMKMLLGKRVIVCFRDGGESKGIIHGFNRYEILLKREDNEEENLIMKHAIDVIVPLEEENPFEKKETKNENEAHT
jgi:sRNA-binding regulator protein Hfq